MAKKTKLKAALSTQQARLKKNLKAKEASQKEAAAANAAKAKSKGKAKAPPSRSTIPFLAEDKILLIGEGNFSFSLSLFQQSSLQYLPPKNVTATAYDTEGDCVRKYPEAEANIAALREKGAEVLFGVDATALEKCKALKGRKWDRILWNFPHAGKGITDQDRNILTNQLLILGFLRSAALFLSLGPVPVAMPSRRKRKKSGDLYSDDEAPTKGDAISEDEEDVDLTPARGIGFRGTVLITLRNVHPYTEWNLPKLAKNPPRASRPNEKENPHYIQLRSFAFRRSDWVGYEHRMTKGERAHGSGTTGQGGEDRTWEFCLKDM